MNSSLLSHRNRTLFFVLIFFLIALLFQVTLSYFLDKAKPEITDYLSKTYGYLFTIDRLNFNLLKGAHLNGVFVFYNSKDRPPVLIKDFYVSIRILPIIFGRVSFNIKIDSMLLLIRKESQGYNLQIMFSDIYKKISEIKMPFSRMLTNRVNIFINTAKFINIDSPHVEKNMYILLKNSRFEQKSGRVKFNSDMEFNYHIPQDLYLSRFLKNRIINQKVKYLMQGRIEGKNLYMDSIELNVEKEQMLGMGVNKDFAEKNPFIDITFIPSAISLNNIAFIKDNFSPEGEAFISLRLKGVLDNTKASIDAQLDNCGLRYNLPNGELLSVKNLRGVLEYENDKIKFIRGYFKINNLPLNIELAASTSDMNAIALNISLPKEYLNSQSQSLKRLDFVFNGKIKKTLMGNLGINALYARKGIDLDMWANFKNLDFDYYNQNEKYFKADTVELVNNNDTKMQKLNFNSFKGGVYLSKNKIVLKELIFSGYNGTVKGRMDLDIKERQSMFTFILHGWRLDVKKIMHDTKISSKLLSGTMSVNLAFNNHPKEYLKGICYIKEGAVDLNTFGSIARFPSLKKVNFYIMHVFFSISRDIIKTRGVRLSSQDIRLNAYWDSNSKINGVFNVKISSRLLGSSVQFRRLLSLTRIKKPYIDFKFLLGGYPDAVRFMWLKGEFKERLEQALPKGTKKIIESRLDRTIEGLSNK